MDSSKSRKFIETNDLRDFPRSERWRLETDGWQQKFGPKHFRDKFYQGMDAGFDYIFQHANDPITPQLIEGLYFSAYAFEDDFKDEEFREGIRSGSSGFEVYFPAQGIAEDAGISEEGLDEFIDNLIDARNNRDNGSPRWRLKISIGQEDPFYIGFNDGIKEDLNVKIFDINDRTELKKFLSEQLTNAALTKAKALDSKNYTGPPTKVEIACPGRYSKKALIKFIEREVNKYLQDIAHKEGISDPGLKENQKIAAIVRFIRSLHQTHCFPDGNGRTFVFLLANLLLMQNNFGVRITQTPAHFAGFSTRQLVSETQYGLEKLKEYKVTAAATYLGKLSAQQILKEPKKIFVDLNNYLSANPMIAMAQLNELFLRIRENSLPVPPKYWGDRYNLSFLNTFSSSFKNDNTAHDMILGLLKEKYLENYMNLHSSLNSKDEDILPEAIPDWLTKHDILKDIRYSFNDKKQTDLYAIIEPTFKASGPSASLK